MISLRGLNGEPALSAIGTKQSTPIRQACPLLAEADVLP
jgi:hypothetical protein